MNSGACIIGQTLDRDSQGNRGKLQAPSLAGSGSGLSARTTVVAASTVSGVLRHMRVSLFDGDANAGCVSRLA